MTVSPTARNEALGKLEAAHTAAEAELSAAKASSRPRGCHFAATSSPFSTCFNRDGEGVSAK